MNRCSRPWSGTLEEKQAIILSCSSSLLLYLLTFQVHDVTVPVKGGEIPARIYIPRVASGEEAVEDRGVMIWLHGRYAIVLVCLQRTAVARLGGMSDDRTQKVTRCYTRGW